MPRFCKRSTFQTVMPSWESSCGTFSVNPSRLVVDDFLTSNIVADKVHQRTSRSWKYFLKRFQYESIDQHMVHGCEIRPHGHIVQVVVRFVGSQRCVNEFTVASRIWNVPLVELSLQRFKLAHGKVMAKPARTAVRQESDLSVLQPKRIGNLPGSIVIGDFDDFTFTKMISATVGSQLRNLLSEARKLTRVKHHLQTRTETVVGVVVTDMRSVFATQSPLSGNSECT